MPRSVAVTGALLAGTLFVNVPVVAASVAGWAAALTVYGWSGLSGWRLIFLGLTLVALGHVASWAWWAFTLPRWRVWALERVQDQRALIRESVRWKLMWPPGHEYEKTEVQSESLESREREGGWNRH
jgi:hypothetical protein